jgi:hypothetical protein
MFTLSKGGGFGISSTTGFWIYLSWEADCGEMKELVESPAWHWENQYL